jgi:hypothetical protein
MFALTLRFWFAERSFGVSFICDIFWFALSFFIFFFLFYYVVAGNYGLFSG